VIEVVYLDKPFVDLHIHSFYSDGSMSPEEIVEAAVANGVGTLAVTDHDTLEGCILAESLCRENGIHFIPAAEINALDRGINYHLLAYGVDVANVQFKDLISHTRFMLDEMSVRLVELLQPDFPQVSLDDFFCYSYDRTLGGWKALHYFMDRGLTQSLKDGFMLYPEYGVSYSQAGFPSVSAVSHRIRKAGGRTVLAHPGEMIDSSDISAFEDELRRIIALGIDGIECYYPLHSQHVTQTCLDLCDEFDLMITAGSDCHGTFGRTRVGEMDIHLDRLRLKDLIAPEE